MNIDRQTVLGVARLARLHLDEQDVSMMADTLKSILGWFDQLKSVDTSGIEPATHAIPLVMPLREDEIRQTNTVAELLQNAPHAQYNLFVVPKVVE
jgi:aspartyl-tRNA(Asn)/glutamyl-tRNA(Gln) amidotransferase subunit C